ncbi:hypothetical protein EYF80_018167 [Liparis tanakae]|uniref:Uncharacterized protein n=1 Tax=Liparis tanakae TaxID=230148 RepID=A0A4Z2I310_9TELE|nr:hypothetical protein EYF80_018167 [Liparis tanakae]
MSPWFTAPGWPNVCARGFERLPFKTGTLQTTLEKRTSSSYTRHSKRIRRSRKSIYPPPVLSGVMVTDPSGTAYPGTLERLFGSSASVTPVSHEVARRKRKHSWGSQVSPVCECLRVQFQRGGRKDVFKSDYKINTGTRIIFSDPKQR